MIEFPEVLEERGICNPGERFGNRRPTNSTGFQRHRGGRHIYSAVLGHTRLTRQSRQGQRQADLVGRQSRRLMSRDQKLTGVSDRGMAGRKKTGTRKDEIRRSKKGKAFKNLAVTQ